MRRLRNYFRNFDMVDFGFDMMALSIVMVVFASCAAMSILIITSTLRALGWL